MSWSSVDLPDSEQANFALDRPMFVAGNGIPIENPSVPAQWSIGPDGDFLDTNVADYVNWPTRRISDGFYNNWTKPGLTSLTGVFRTWFMCVLDTAAVFDCAFILGHNFGDLCAAGVLLTLVISDDAEFGISGQLTKFGTGVLTPLTSNARLQHLSLGTFGGFDAQRYTVSGTAYLRLLIQTADSSDFLTVPRIGEIILGHRCQLDRNPDRPWDSDNWKSRSDLYRPKAGPATRYKRTSGGKVLQPRFSEVESSLITDIRTLNVNSDYFNNPIIWIEKPYSDPATYYVMIKDSASLQLPKVGPYSYDLNLPDLEEQQPYLTSEG